MVEVAQDLQLGVGDGHIDGCGTDVDAKEPQLWCEPYVVRAAPAAGCGESVGHDEPGLQQSVDLDGELGAGEIDLIPQLCA